jgi:tetratricopeptide (TPR) repeat protein
VPNQPSVRAALLDDLGTREPVRWPLVLALAGMAVEHGDPTAWPWLGRAALALSRPDAAAQALHARLAQGQGEPLLVGGLLEVLFRHGQLTLAKSLAEQALGQRSTPEVRIAHAQILLALGESDAARQSLQQALADTQELGLLARIHEVRADLEQSLGQIHRAAAERSEADRLRRDSKQP